MPELYKDQFTPWKPYRNVAGLDPNAYKNPEYECEARWMQSNIEDQLLRIMSIVNIKPAGEQ